MLADSVTPEKAISFTKMMVKITYIWPLPATASRRETLRFKVIRSLLGLSAFLLFLPLVNAIYTYRNDPLNIVKSVCLTTATIQIIAHNAISTRHYTSLQMLLDEFEEYVRTATSWKKSVLQTYTENCAKFYMLAMIWFYFNGIFILLGPFILTSDEFPTNAEYPFVMESTTLKVVIYLHQSFVMIQCAGQVSANAFIAILLWFAAARFDILAIEMRNVREIGELRNLIRAHQNLIRYTDKIVETMRYLTLTTVLACFVSLIFNGLTFLVPMSPESKIQFGILNGTALMEIFMIAWPANRLMDAYDRIADSLYDSKWYDAPLDVRKTIPFVLMRARKPAVVSVSCILPPISLKYFASFVSGAFSYFTTLRILVENN